MTWVKGHYRKTNRGLVRVRGHSRDNGGDDGGALGALCLIILGITVFGIYWLVRLTTDIIEIVKTHTVDATIAAACTGAILTIYLAVRLHTRFVRRKLLRYAISVCTGYAAPTELLEQLGKTRRKVGALPESDQLVLAAAYRELVALIVDDGIVTGLELDRLRRTEEALQLQPETVRAARKHGFLAVYEDAIADGALTEEEESILGGIRTGLGVCGWEVGEELALVTQLSSARKVLESVPQPITGPTRLPNAEVTYYEAPAQEFVLRKRTGLQSNRTGTLYVTSARLMFIDQQRTTIKHERIVDASVDRQRNMLVVVKDGRVGPYYFALDEPFVALAHLQRSMHEWLCRAKAA